MRDRGRFDRIRQCDVSDKMVSSSSEDSGRGHEEGVQKLCKLGEAENGLPSNLWRSVLASKSVKLMSAFVSAVEQQ